MTMNQITKYAIRYRCPLNLEQMYFESTKTKVWACGMSVPIELTAQFEYAILFLSIDDCYKYIKQHDMTGVEVVDVVVQIPE